MTIIRRLIRRLFRPRPVPLPHHAIRDAEGRLVVWWRALEPEELAEVPDRNLPELASWIPQRTGWPHNTNRRTLPWP